MSQWVSCTKPGGHLMTDDNLRRTLVHVLHMRSSVFSSGLPIDSKGVLPIYPASLAWSFKMY